MQFAEVQKILLEALAVAMVGAGLAFAANETSPRGLALGRNYFPSGGAAATNAAPIVTPPAQQDGSGEDAVGARLKGKGLIAISRDDVQKALGDPQVILIDARSEEKFEEGHIPGAYEIDPYHSERALGTVLPLCQAATKVVVYCEGGECEDADAVAIMLRDAGVPADHLEVYGGGMGDWRSQRKTVETGAQL